MKGNEMGYVKQWVWEDDLVVEKEEIDEWNEMKMDVWFDWQKWFDSIF